MPTITSLVNHMTFTELADTTARVVAEQYSKDPGLMEVKSLYSVHPIEKNSGTQRIFTSYGKDSYANRMPESGDATLSRHVQGKSKTMYMVRYGKNVSFSYISKNFSNNSQVVDDLTTLSEYIPNRMALDLTHRLTFATAISYADMDGETVDTTIGGDTLAVVYSTHTLNGSSTTVSNVITSNPRFSKGAYEVAKNVAKAASLDEFGLSVEIDFNTVVTANEATTIDSVLTLMRSTSNPDVNNSGVVNNHKNQFRHVILKKLDTDANGAYDTTKQYRWAYMAVGRGPKYNTFHLGIWEDAHSVAADTDIRNDDQTLGTRGSWGICVVDFRGIVLSTGLGA